MRFCMYLFAAFFNLFVTLSHAAPIVVRSGAHDGFSRLVLNVQPSSDWSIETDENSASITIRGHTGGFDTGGVFDRIDQTHIAQLNSSAETLDVRFSCICEVSAFEQGNTMIVLDISSLSGEPSPPKASTGQFQNEFKASQPFRFGNRISSASVTQSDPMPITWNKSLATQPAVINTQPFAEASEDSDAIANSLAEVQQRISQQVGTAATRGLLTPKPSPIDLPLVQNRPQIDTQIFDSSKVERSLESAGVSPKGGNLKITSSSDVPNRVESSSVSTTLGIRCIAPSITAIEDWASTDQLFSVQIAERRNELFSEFDRLDQEAAVRLARTYLYFGFGLEVREVLALDTELARGNPALLEMAEIMEFGFSKHPEYLHHFMECDTNVALWAILSKRSIEPAESINTSAALRAVTGLPMHLRAFIAPELSRRLLSYGAPDAAAAALRSLERTAVPLSSDAILAKADLEMERGNVSEAQNHLAHVVASNSEQSAEALIKFVESHLEADAQIEQNVATLVEAYALELRDDPLGAELRRTHVLALGKSGQFNAAFDALERVRERGGNTSDDSVASALFDLLARNGSNIDFLDHVFQQIPVSLDVVELSALLRIADRLVDLGFASEAELVLAARTDIPNNDKARMIKAKIALSLERPFEAEAMLFGLGTTEADVLRAEAKAKSGSFDEAHSLFSELGEENGSRQTAWLSNDWVSLVGDDTPVLGPVARIAQTEISDDTTTDGMLLRTSEAITESAEARSVIEELLRVSNPAGKPEQ